MLHKILHIAIALVWLINGLYCKVLNFVPRHQQIVARIQGDAHAGVFTMLIGLSEIAMALWILSRIRSKYCAIVQAIIIATMNIIEFIKAPDLLLFGHLNVVFATLLISIILLNEFATRPPAPDKL